MCVCHEIQFSHIPGTHVSFWKIVTEITDEAYLGGISGVLSPNFDLNGFGPKTYFLPAWPVATAAAPGRLDPDWLWWLRLLRLFLLAEPPLPEEEEEPVDPLFDIDDVLDEMEWLLPLLLLKEAVFWRLDGLSGGAAAAAVVVVFATAVTDGKLVLKLACFGPDLLWGCFKLLVEAVLLLLWRELALLWFISLIRFWTRLIPPFLKKSKKRWGLRK